MAGKKIVNEDELQEFNSSSGVASTADPYDAGDTSRSADKSAGETGYSFSTKSEVLSAIMSQIGNLNKDQLGNLYKGLSGPEGQAGRSADKSGGEGGQVSTSPTAVKPVTSATLANAGGSAPYAHNSSTGTGEKGQIRTSPTSVVAKEDVEEIFGGDELSEELKEKAVIVFEAAINARLVTEVARLEEEFEAALEESVEEIRKEIVENVDKYLSYAVEEWVEENQVAIDTGLKSEMAEELIHGLKSIFEANYIDIPETKVDVVAEMAEKIEDLESRLNEEIEKNITLEQTKQVLEVDGIFESVCEGLAKTQVEKLRTLAEGIVFESADEFERKVSIIKETYFPANKPSTSESMITEEVDTDDDSDRVQATGAMANYVQTLSKSVKK